MHVDRAPEPHTAAPPRPGNSRDVRSPAREPGPVVAARAAADRHRGASIDALEIGDVLARGIADDEVIASTARCLDLSLLTHMTSPRLWCLLHVSMNTLFDRRRFFAHVRTIAMKAKCGVKWI